MAAWQWFSRHCTWEATLTEWCLIAFRQWVHLQVFWVFLLFLQRVTTFLTSVFLPRATISSNMGSTLKRNLLLGPVNNSDSDFSLKVVPTWKRKMGELFPINLNWFLVKVISLGEVSTTLDVRKLWVWTRYDCIVLQMRMGNRDN